MNKLEKIEKIYNKWEGRVNSVREFVERKNFQRFATFSAVTFILLLTAPSYAQDEVATLNSWKIDGAMSYDECYNMQVDQGYSDEDALLRDGGDTTCHKFITGGLDAVGVVIPNALEGFEEGGTGLNGTRNSLEAKGGIVGVVDDANYALLYNQPSVDIVAHLSDEWVPGQDLSRNAIYAQVDDGTSGYQYLSFTNIQDIWSVTRMIAYALFVVALIIAGFMIMFRQKIGGQMAVTIFNTIPKVIVGLILVTFSFAIVGLVIDFGVLLNNIIANILVPEGDPLHISNPLSLFNVMLRGDTGLGELTNDLAVASLGMGLVGGLLFITGLGAPLGSGLLLGGLGVIVLILVIAGIILYASIKVFITLLKAWVGLIVDTIMGPIYLVIAVIPGRSSTGWNWFYRVVKNVLTFVGVFLLINLAGYLYSQNINLYFPAGLAGGTASAIEGPMAGVLNWLMNAVLPLFLFFMAAEVPNFLSDFLPADGGKGASTAFGNVQKSFTKIPVVGSAFG